MSTSREQELNVFDKMDKYLLSSLIGKEESKLFSQSADAKHYIECFKDWIFNLYQIINLGPMKVHILQEEESPITFEKVFRSLNIATNIVFRGNTYKEYVACLNEIKEFLEENRITKELQGELLLKFKCYDAHIGIKSCIHNFICRSNEKDADALDQARVELVKAMKMYETHWETLLSKVAGGKE